MKLAQFLAVLSKCYSLTRHQASYSGSTGWYFRYQSIHFQITYTYRGSQFYWRKPEYPEITTELRQVTDKLYHRIWYTSPWAWVELTTSVIIGTDCIGSYKSIRSRPRRPRLLLEWFVYFVFSYIIDHCCFILIFNRLKAYRRFDSKIKYF